MQKCEISWIHQRENRFSLEYHKTKTKFHWPITTDPNSTMNQSEFEANTGNRRQARENHSGSEQVTFGFTSCWLRKWRGLQSQNIVKQNANYFRYSIKTTQRGVFLFLIHSISAGTLHWTHKMTYNLVASTMVIGSNLTLLKLHILLPWSFIYLNIHFVNNVCINENISACSQFVDN